MTAATDRVDPHYRNRLWRFLQRILQNIFVFWLRYRVRGLEHLPPNGALLLINHQSALDPLAAGVALTRPVSYLARHELFSLPVIGWILKNTYVMPIRRESAGSESIRLCIERLAQGYYVGVFPEGTRSGDGRLQPIKPGFLAIVRRSEAPVIPVGVAGTGSAYPRGAIFPRPATVRVVMGEPIPPDVCRELSARGREKEFLALIEQRMSDCLEAAENWRRGEPPEETD